MGGWRLPALPGWRVVVVARDGRLRVCFLAGFGVRAVTLWADPLCHSEIEALAQVVPKVLECLNAR